MIDEEEDPRIGSVDLAILYGGSVHLHASGAVVLITSEGEDELTGREIDALGVLLQRAQAIRGR